MEDRVVKLEQAMSSLPTKADFAELRADVKIGISDLRAEMHKNSIDLHRWMLATVVGLFLGFGGLFLAMSNGLKQPTPQQQPPMIITAPAAPAPTVASPTTQPASR